MAGERQTDDRMGRDDKVAGERQTEPVKPGSDAHMERLAIRMIYKVCPAKDTHTHRTGEWSVEGDHCPQCGIDRSDFDRFIVGNEGKPDV